LVEEVLSTNLIELVHSHPNGCGVGQLVEFHVVDHRTLRTGRCQRHS